MNLRFRPLTQWPADRPRSTAADRKSSPFRGRMGRVTPYSTTLSDLDHELRQLDVDDAVLQVDVVSERDIRLDGFMRADAKVKSPAVVLTFEKPVVGTLRDVPVTFACDAFHTWHENLRAIVLTMESLRRVDRYGVVAAGQQYRGFAALPATTTPALSTEQAARVLATRSSSGDHAPDILQYPAIASNAFRSARARAHPDAGGSSGDFQLVTEAGRVLAAHHGVASL